MPKISIKIDPESGLLKCNIFPSNMILEEFFESEIQGDPAFIRYLNQSIDNLFSDTLEINGNAHCLKLTKSVYEVTSLYEATETRVMGPLSDFIYFLEEWENALSSHQAS